LSIEIQDLFEQTYFLKENPRFKLVDYTISTDRSASPAPPAPGKRQDTTHMKRRFEGVISIDGQEHELKGFGNGPISSLANALHSVGIDLDVADYKEHAIGGGRDVKAASYIECTAAGSNMKVWGVGVHEDVVQSSLIALLSAASNVCIVDPSYVLCCLLTCFQFITSRPNTPLLLRGKHGGKLSQDLDLEQGSKENGHLSIPKPNGAPRSGPDAVSVLEAKVNQLN